MCFFLHKMIFVSILLPTFAVSKRDKAKPYIIVATKKQNFKYYEKFSNTIKAKNFS